MKNTLLFKKIFDIGINLVVGAIEAHNNKRINDMSDEEVLDAIKHPKISDLAVVVRDKIARDRERDADADKRTIDSREPDTMHQEESDLMTDQMNEDEVDGSEGVDGSDVEDGSDSDVEDVDADELDQDDDEVGEDEEVATPTPQPARTTTTAAAPAPTAAPTVTRQAAPTTTTPPPSTTAPSPAPTTAPPATRVDTTKQPKR